MVLLSHSLLEYTPKFFRLTYGVYSKSLKMQKTPICVNVEEIKSIMKEQREDAENLMSRAIPRDVPKEELLTNLSIPNVLAILGEAGNLLYHSYC
ncbi:hypothetical protein Ahos_1580 [Acidianus hospitalis W1]|uniref:Uncharacterized protein n=1 Tax=Acidianus hospitalis (strain W1) TaxID=933801 RepID=F4B5W5_ACIHW|nr:hypothetical protein Ahos_1580 [Acidianus hospitalis W1]